MTTAVTLKGWHCTLYYAPLLLLHDAVTLAMMNSAARSLGRPGDRPSRRSTGKNSPMASSKTPR